MTIPFLVWLAAAGIALGAAFLGGWWGYKGAAKVRDWRMRQEIEDLYDLHEVLSNRVARREGRAGGTASAAKRAQPDPAEAEAEAIIAAFSRRGKSDTPPQLAGPPPGDTFDLPERARLKPGRKNAGQGEPPEA